MTDTPEAVRLADFLEQFKTCGHQLEDGTPVHLAAAALLRRIPELEAEAQEQARLNGMGAERELALRAQVSRLEAERDQLRVALSATQPAQAAQSEPFADTWFAVLDTLDQLYGRKWRKRCETLHDSLLTTLKAQAQQAAGEVVAYITTAADGEILVRHRGKWPHDDWVKNGWRPLTYADTPPAPASQPVAQGVPEGWKLVPVEPTEEMSLAGRAAWQGHHMAVYRAMLTASPTPPAQQPMIPLSMLRPVAVEAIRVITGCPDISNGGKHLTDEI